MIRRLLGFVAIAWALGFAGFAFSLPGPAGKERTDGIVVLTGGKGRLQRGLLHLGKGRAKRLLVSGVARDVDKDELAEIQRVSKELVRCCVDLGKEARDTRGNAREAARWLRARGYTSVRLVTTDWHMARARLLLGQALGPQTRIVPDAVKSAPTLQTLFLEYNKLIASWAADKIGL